MKNINQNYFRQSINNIAVLICSISLALDLLLFIDISSPPAWDQGYHLSNLFKMYNIISNDNINLDIKLDRILNVTDNYRGPLTYFLSSLKLFFINNSYKVAYISNHIFNTICIISIFELGKLIKDSKTGFWASIFFTFSPFNIIVFFIIIFRPQVFCNS